VVFTAADDGMYWFSFQFVLKSQVGNEPDDLKDLQPLMKVFVNTKRTPVVVEKSHQDLEREVRRLKMSLGNLKKRIKELESDPMWK